jgi:adenylate cyclase class 2
MAKKGWETEVKLYVLESEKVERRLQALGAQLIQDRIFETNHRFDLPDRSFRLEGRVLRLRQDREAYLTYKGPSVLTEGVLSRPEYEFIVSDFELARRTLEALGYQLTAVYEKYRSVFALEDTRIMLDELPYGHFVEIEGQDIDAIRKVTEKLKLNFDCAIPNSYLRLFEHICGQFNLDPEKLTFAALANISITAQDLGVKPADR